jgi:hypothetical protein
VLYSQLKSYESKVDNILTKATALSINLNIDGVPIVSRSDTHPSHSQTTRILLGCAYRVTYVTRVLQMLETSRNAFAFADTVEYAIFAQVPVIA